MHHYHIICTTPQHPRITLHRHFRLRVRHRAPVARFQIFSLIPHPPAVHQHTTPPPSPPHMNLPVTSLYHPQLSFPVAHPKPSPSAQFRTFGMLLEPPIFFSHFSPYFSFLVIATMCMPHVFCISYSVFLFM